MAMPSDSIPNVKLIWVTPNAEQLMAYIARVSSPNQENVEYAKLLEYCIRKKHWSVLEHAYCTLEISTSRAVARQLLRHRSFTFSEFSQRYAAQESAEYIDVRPRRQDIKNRQSSHDDLPEGVHKAWRMQQSRVWDAAMGAYREALRQGVAKECARALLPEGLTPTKLYMTGSARSWVHYLVTRLDPASQLEHRDVAAGCLEALMPHLPVTLAAADKHLFNKPVG